MKTKTLALAAAALLAGLLSFGTAQAANVLSGGNGMPAIQKSQSMNLQTVKHRHWRHRRHSGLWLGFGLPLFYGGYGGYGGGYGGYGGYYDEPFYYSEPLYYRPYKRVGSRHVRWCLNNYITYNPRTDTFKGYDGYRHRCRSPYRY